MVLGFYLIFFFPNNVVLLEFSMSGTACPCISFSEAMWLRGLGTHPEITDRNWNI